MLFDTDILIWVQRRHEQAAHMVQEAEERYLSIQTFMELLQGAQNKQQHSFIKDFISSFDFQVLPLTENIGHRALIYIEEYTLSHNLRAADAVIAATATENNLTLVTGDKKHFSPIQDLKLKIFRP